jgi:lipopolysaccharide/colanic/teichoic acid biosynthesis glycosyltransferase
MRVSNQIPSSRFTYSSALSPLDCVWAALAPYAAFGLRDASLLADPARIDSIVLFAVVAFFSALIAMAALRTGEGLPRFFSLVDLVPIAQAAIVSTALTGVVVFSVTRLNDVPRSILALHAMLLAGGWLAGRLAARILARRRASLDGARRAGGKAAETRVLVVGVNTMAWLFLKMIEENATSTLRVVGFLDSAPQYLGRTVSGCPVVGQPQSIEQLLQEYEVHGVQIDRVIVATPRSKLRAGELAAIRAAQGRGGLEVEFLDELLGLAAGAALGPEPAGAEVIALPRAPRISLSGQWLAKSDLAMPRGPYWSTKRAFDIAAALALSIVLLPVGALVMAVVLAAVGSPALFWQQRVGQGGRSFMIYKFRTLEAPFDRTGRPRDAASRLGRLGSWLRATRLDELPQLMNVLKGDMSIVGPRPLLPVDLPRSDLSRLAVRPGLTGWAQVNGGKMIDAETKNQLDRWYIEYASVWLDLRIIALTIATVVRGERVGAAAIEQARALHAKSAGDGRREGRVAIELGSLAEHGGRAAGL